MTGLVSAKAVCHHIEAAVPRFPGPYRILVFPSTADIAVKEAVKCQFLFHLSLCRLALPVVKNA